LVLFRSAAFRMGLLSKLAGVQQPQAECNEWNPNSYLYAMSGVCAFAALRHGLAVMQRRVSQSISCSPGCPCR